VLLTLHKRGVYITPIGHEGRGDIPVFHTPNIKARPAGFTAEDFADLHRQTRVYQERIAAIYRAPAADRHRLSNQLRAEVADYAAGGASIAPLRRDRDGRHGA
jgi:hypothetical protein